MAEIILILLTTQFLAMMSPGPDMFLILKNSLGQPGKQSAIFTIFGIGLGLTIHLSVSIAGLAIMLVQSEWVYRLLRYAGASYLAYIGIKSLRPREAAEYTVIASQHGKSNAAFFREGLLTNLLNPKVTLYILSLFTQLIPPTTPVKEKLLLAFLLIVEAILVWILFSHAVNTAPVRKRMARYAAWMDRLFGLTLLLIAGSIFFTRG